MTDDARMRVFVYGTLLTGEANHPHLRGAEILGTARTESMWQMVSFGAFPAIVAGGTTAIVGEVYVVDSETLGALDRLEGHPTFYARTLIRLDDGGQVVAYVLPADQAEGLPRLDSGDWRQR